MIKLEMTDFSDDELEKTVSWLNNGSLMRYSENRFKKHTIESQREYISDLSHPHQYRKIICDGVLIGTISAIVDPVNRVADVGILIGPDHTGKGYGSEAWRAFYAELARAGVRKIEGGCMAKNTSMIRIFEKNGMRLEGTRRYHFEVGKNQYDDKVMYGSLL